MIEEFLKKIASLHHVVFGGRELRSHEQICLEAWRATLPEDGRRVLDAQLAAVRLIQHQAGGAKVCFYYKDGVKVPLFSVDQPDVHVATVVLRSVDDAGESPTMRVKLFVHRGRFFSIEFPKRPERYMQQHGMRSEALQVAAVEKHMLLN